MNEDHIARLREGFLNHLDAWNQTGSEYDARALIDIIERMVREIMRTNGHIKWGDSLVRNNK